MGLFTLPGFYRSKEHFTSVFFLLISVWNVSGMCVEYVWNVSGMCLECTAVSLLVPTVLLISFHKSMKLLTTVNLKQH